MKTTLRASISIAPCDHVAGDVAGLVGNFAFDLVAMLGVSRQRCSKVNIALTEQITAVIESTGSLQEPLEIRFGLEDDVMTTSAKALPRDSAPASADDSKVLLAETVSARRIERASGGLGLVRVTEESKFRLSAMDKPKGSGSGEGGAPAEMDALPPLPIKPS